MLVEVLDRKPRNLKPKKRNWKRTGFIAAMLAFPLIQFLVFFVYVNIDSVLMTFEDPYTNTYTLDNYTRFFGELFSKTDPHMQTAFRNSLLFGLNDLILVLISLVLSYFFFKKIKGRSFFRIVFFLPSIISMVIYTMAYKYMFEVGGPVEQLFSIFGQEAPYWLADEKLSYFLIAGYCLWVGTGYNILIFGGAMANINSEVIEYAKLDGVGMTRELFQIILPMIWPTISVAFIGSVTTIFTLFMQVDLIGGDNSYAPRTIAYLLNYAVQTQPEYAATIGICFTVIATPMILVVRKGIDLIGKKFGY